MERRGTDRWEVRVQVGERHPGDDARKEETRRMDARGWNKKERTKGVEGSWGVNGKEELTY